ncbi:MAG: hypothetical protein JNJ50_29880 [Acidobacteria bacterium]|nr:hypothetical protein [Acidobacteriota bacterium]
MKRKISEFSYGFVLTHELVHVYDCWQVAATVVRASEAKKKGKQQEIGLSLRGYPLFLQFKLSEYMQRRYAAESKVAGLPYFRFELPRRSQSNQHRLLMELEKRGNAVFYVAPLFHEAASLNSAFFDRQIVAQSVFISPGDISELPDSKLHRVVYSRKTPDVHFCSKPRKLEHVIQGETFSDAIKELLKDREPQLLDDNFFEQLSVQMLSIFSPNRKMFGDMSREQVEMHAATFASYIAKTFFDCELLIIRA